MAPPPPDNDNKETKKRKPHKKAKKSKHKKTTSTNETSISTTKESTTPKAKLPLKGLVVSVTTLQQAQNESTSASTTTTPLTQGYRDVAQQCRDLGAQVVGQVSKRVHWLIASESAVQQATQRIRKAHQKNIPIVSTAWIQHIISSSMESTQKVDPNKVPSEYLLNEAAKKAIQQRKDQPAKDGNEHHDDETVDPNAGWTEPVSFGCSCVCHENGAEKDCPWCKSEPCAQAAPTKA